MIDERPPARNHIVKSDDTLGGTPRFKGTRIPVYVLTDHLATGYTLDGFLEQYPSLTKEIVVETLEHARELLEKNAVAPSASAAAA